MQRVITIVGLDPSLRNWGIVLCKYNTSTKKLTLNETHIIQTKPDKSKHIRQNSKDIESASTLYKDLVHYISIADIICVEVPHGSKSARAMASYGVCIGILGSLQPLNSKVIQVSANEVKAVIGLVKPSKKDVIDWVKQKHPNEVHLLPKTLKAEHVCDALVAIYASMNKPKFKEYIHEINTHP